MAKKKKVQKAAPKQSGATKKRVLATPIIASIGVLAVVVICAATAIFMRDSKIREADERAVQEQQNAQTAVVSYIDDVLEATSGSARVYDASGNVLFTLTYSNGISGVDALPPYLAQAIQEKVLGGVPVSKIDLDAWSDSHTTLGSLFNSQTEEEMRAGSLGWEAVQRFCTVSKTMLSDGAKFVISAYLDTAYTAEELLTFIACTESYGSYSGIVDASAQWFNKTLDKLNENQMDYLTYAFANTAPSFDDFAELYPDSTSGAETAEAFGFQQVGTDPYWLLKKEVRAELDQLIGSRLQDESFNVSLEIDTVLQGRIQEALDNGLRSSIELGADGLTTIDGAVGVVNPKNGFVVALVGGRSINSVSREFELDCTSLIGNYKAAADAMEEDPTLTYATLKPVEIAAGTTDYVQFGALVVYDQLGSIGISPTVEAKSTLDELLSFGSSLYTDVEPRLISEIQSTDGTVVYTAPTATDVSAQAPNPDIRALLMNTTDATSAEYIMTCNTGIAQGEFTSEYILGVLCGTMTTGYQMTFEDSDACMTTAFNLANLLEEYYPREPESIDPSGSVAAKVAAAQAENSKTVTEAVEEWITELSEMPINSVGTAGQFEQYYTAYTNQLHNYVGLVDDALFDELHDRLDAVRAARASELLQFAA